MSDPRVLRSLSRLESDTLDRPDPDGLRRERKVEDGLTIFIPNWNHRTYLPRSIRSALDALECLEQAGYSAEVLVADDASRDGSQKLLRSVQLLYEEPRLKPLFLGRNLGLPRLRNLALQVSRYRYVCLMDADNQLVPENLPLFVRSIKETGAALVHGNLIVKRGDEVTGAWSNEVATMRLQERNYIDAFSVVDAQKLSSLGGYTSNSQLYGREDWEMVLHLIAEEEQIVFVPAVMGYYYTNPLSMIQEETNVRGQETNAPAQESEALLQRMYAQGGTRGWDSARVGRVYHPAVGFVDEW